jgi:hypothetical protein
MDAALPSSDRKIDAAQIQLRIPQQFQLISVFFQKGAIGVHGGSPWSQVALSTSWTWFNLERTKAFDIPERWDFPYWMFNPRFQANTALK